MDTLTIDGVYEDGTIKLSERPVGLTRARVRVTFISESDETSAADEREAACRRAFEQMRDGIDFGGERFDRDELYEERLRELETRQGRRR